MKVKSGISRKVILIFGYAIKFPRTWNMLNFLNGCYANWSERMYYKNIKDCVVEPGSEYLKDVTPSYFCTWFGLVQIQARAKELPPDTQIPSPSMCGTDNKPTNFGIYKERIVCLDYP